MRVGFLDNVRLHFKNNDEEEFERAFRDPSWPVGVDDFEPMSNTGSFLPATYDVDPLADASLPGNAYHGNPDYGAAPQDPNAYYGQGGAPDSVVRAPATPLYAVEETAQEATASYGADGSAAQQATTVYQNVIAFPGTSLPVQPPAATVSQPEPGTPVETRPSGYAETTPRYEMEDEGVHVVARQGGARPSGAVAPAASQKPFADRLRERVAAANVAGQNDDTLGRSRATLDDRPAAPRPAPRRNENASAEDLDAEFEERRRARKARGTATQETRAAVRPEEAKEPAAPSDGGRPADASPSGLRPIPISCLVVRPRSYDDVAEIARGLIGEHRPVVMVLRGCSNELARRVVDFSFGLCCASGAEMKDFGNHVYGVLPRGTTFTDEDAMALRRQGIVLRG